MKFYDIHTEKDTQTEKERENLDFVLYFIAFYLSLTGLSKIYMEFYFK